MIATFAIFTITSISLNYCFGNDWDYSHLRPDCCQMCGGNNLNEAVDTIFDGKEFNIITFVCQDCNYWHVFYDYDPQTI